MDNEKAYAYYNKTLLLIFRISVVRNEYVDVFCP